MPFSATLKKLIRRDATAPSLRERAAELRAHISPRAAEPRTIAGNSPTEAATPSEPATETDAELLRLGRQFEAASARETAANEACNAAQRHGRHAAKALDDAANVAGDKAAALAERIAGLPAHTAAGFRVKL